MNIVVPIKFVPDPVEDLEIDSSTGLLDRSFLRLMPNELDDHALEQALLLTERHGGAVTVVTLDWGDVDETLFTALAKGAKRAIKIRGEGFDQGLGSMRIAAILHQAIKDVPFDLILTGTQALDDLDGFVGALLAERLHLPYVGYVTKVAVEDGKVTATKEYPGGVGGEIAAALPAVLGIQAAEKPPRYVVTAKVMEAMKSGKIEELDGAEVSVGATTTVAAMALPESGARAEMLPGGVADVAAALVKILRDRGVMA